MHQELTDKLRRKTAKLGVIGLGYVGLPAACLFAEAGFSVTGIDVKAERVATINAGLSPIEGDEPGMTALVKQVITSGSLQATTDYARIADADIVLLVVDTPVDQETHKPHYEAMKAACRSLSVVMKRGVLIIVESTVSPGTVQNVITPILEQGSGKFTNVDFFLGACPERVMPGKLISNLKNLSRVCGGSTPETARVMVELYSNIVHAELDEADIVTAELVKTGENAYRDVQIAFANEIAQICEVLGANVWRVRELINKSPGRNMLMPGAGVGGHCIPKDPWLLAAGAGDAVSLRVIPAARYVNDHMPLHVANLLVRALKKVGRLTEDTKIAVLGFAYLEESDDTRNSPSEALTDQLDSIEIDYVIHDPWVAPYKGDLLTRAAGCDAVVIMVRHKAYLDMNLDELKAILRTPVIIDGRNAVDPERAVAAGFAYYGIGRGDSPTLQG